jgi:polysaccharide export outer membrane protein
MKTPCVFALFAIVFAAAPLDRAGAQSPFSSTSPPNSNPFGNSASGFGSPGGFGPVRPSQLASAQSPPLGQAAYPAAAAAPATYSSAPADPNHRLGVGDRLSYRVQEDRDGKVWPLVVTSSGEVDIPLLGRVKAEGKSTTQLTSDIRGALEREYYNVGHATVIMGLDSVAPEVSRGRVYLTGAVRTQGALDLPTGDTLTVSQAIVQSGGKSDFSDLKHVKIIRKGGPRKGIIVNVKAVLDGQTDKDVLLEPGDTIAVPEKTFNISF